MSTTKPFKLGASVAEGHLSSQLRGEVHLELSPEGRLGLEGRGFLGAGGEEFFWDQSPWGGGSYGGVFQ